MRRVVERAFGEAAGVDAVEVSLELVGHGGGVAVVVAVVALGPIFETNRVAGSQKLDVGRVDSILCHRVGVDALARGVDSIAVVVEGGLPLRMSFRILGAMPRDVQSDGGV